MGGGKEWVKPGFFGAEIMIFGNNWPKIIHYMLKRATFALVSWNISEHLLTLAVYEISLFFTKCTSYTIYTSTNFFLDSIKFWEPYKLT